MEEKRKVILITDGDVYARRAVELAARAAGGRCISLSQGNPSVLTGEEIVSLIKSTPHDPVLVMFDDSGLVGEGCGETAMRYVANHEDIDVLGIIAVASNTRHGEWTRVDVCIDHNGQLTPYGVDKYGTPEYELGRINGDTVYCVDELHAPIVVGVGDIGKMAGKDDYRIGAPITKMAVEIILERSGYHGIGNQNSNETDS
ncbi:stage V sporulation protein AE [Bacillus sp. V5-8f]|uniref:stage V sporulation protein AE n=1 Tax=Bacillus sp. V5-8f TaxID=2053044 RepID=UPI000C75BAC1|nr:stage V sporulation protein AE [Bacillus sp. V5-8f]PLT35253.1 stage V sporulation protein AE [Bacillus sp. V5-8f]